LATNERTGGTADRLAAILELGVNGSFDVCDHLTVRAGYNFLYLSGVALAPEQLDSRPNIAGSRQSVSAGGSIFMYGPSTGFDIVW
jgi:hypothetical protein